MYLILNTCGATVLVTMAYVTITLAFIYHSGNVSYMTFTYASDHILNNSKYFALPGMYFW